MFKKVLVPLDGSAFSARALPYATEIARCFGGEVMLLQVVRPPQLAVPMAGGDAMASATTISAMAEATREEEKQRVAKAKRYLAGRLRKLTDLGITASYEVIVGEPAKTIIRFCYERAVDLVVMTTSGKSGLKRAILGSVADEVIREPGIPVLAVRPRGRRTR